MGAMIDAPGIKNDQPRQMPIGHRFQKGISGNPSGRPAIVKDLQAKARELAPAALQALQEALLDPRTKVQAAQVLLDRGYGKAIQRQELSGPDGAPIQVQQVPDDRPTLDGFLVEFSEQKQVESSDTKESDE